MFSDKRQRSFHKAYHDITENEYRRASHKAISYLIDSFVVHSRVVDVSLYTTVAGDCSIRIIANIILLLILILLSDVRNARVIIEAVLLIDTITPNYP